MAPTARRGAQTTAAAARHDAGDARGAAQQGVRQRGRARPHHPVASRAPSDGRPARDHAGRVPHGGGGRVDSELTGAYDAGMDSPQATRLRRRVVVDQRDLAEAIGGRIRAARLAAGLTQQALAGDRYTKAYISALELGHAKPSMAALDYLAPRLGTTPDRLLADEAGRWTRVDADLHLAAGRYPDAVVAYRDLADRTVEPVRRGELLLGAGEAAARLRDPVDAGSLLAEASALLEQGGRLADRVRARYWLAWVHMAHDDPGEARRLLLGLLDMDLAQAEDPDLEVRIRMALAAIENSHGSPERAALYLDEARAAVDGMDLRRRAVYFELLTRTRHAAGDAEGAIRAGLEAITLYRAAEQTLDVADLENELAMSFQEIGNL